MTLPAPARFVLFIEAVQQDEPRTIDLLNQALAKRVIGNDIRVDDVAPDPV